MTTTTYSEFNQATEALEVAKAFAQVVSGKTILVTGVSRGGIGFTTVQAFASQAPSKIIIASRTPAKIQECIDNLKEDFPNVDYRPLKLNLSSQKDVRTAAAEVMSWSDVPAIDIVVNNAAVMNMPERELSEEGIEMHFATNHIGHFLFTNLIMPKLIKAAERNPKGATRIINVSSLSPTISAMRWSDVNFDKTNKDLPKSEQPPYEMHKRWGVDHSEEKSYVPIEAYGQSKVANVLFGIQLSNLLYEKHGILSLSCHPGIIRTELDRYAGPEMKDVIKMFLESGQFYVKTLEGGAATSVLIALDPKLSMPVNKDGKENHGAFFADCQINGDARPESISNASASRLWTLSEELVKEKFSW